MFKVFPKWVSFGNHDGYDSWYFWLLSCWFVHFHCRSANYHSFFIAFDGLKFEPFYDYLFASLLHRKAMEELLWLPFIAWENQKETQKKANISEYGKPCEGWKTPIIPDNEWYDILNIKEKVSSSLIIFIKNHFLCLFVAPPHYRPLSWNIIVFFALIPSASYTSWKHPQKANHCFSIMA